MAAVVPFDPEVSSGSVCAIIALAGSCKSVHNESERLFGFAVFNEEQRSFKLCEYKEDCHASKSESLFLQLQPRNCLVLASAEDTRKLSRVAESCGVDLIQLKQEDVKQADLEQDLCRLLVDGEGIGLAHHLEEQRQKQGMLAIGALVSHHKLLNDPSNFAACTLNLYPLNNFMYLDKAAFSALNVLPRPDESLRSSTSLLGFLNRCRSDMGTRRLRQWLTQPLTNADEITRRHDVIEAFCSTEEMLRELEGMLRRVPDLERLAAKLHRTSVKTCAASTKANLEDIANIYQCALSVDAMIRTLSSYSGTHKEIVAARLTQPLQACMTDFANFRSLVEQTIDLTQAEQRTYCINHTFDASLGLLAAQRDRVREKMVTYAESVNSSLELAKKGKEKGVSLVEYGDSQALRVTKQHQQALQTSKNQSKYKPLSIKKNEFVFTTAELEKLSLELKTALKAYDDASAQLAAKTLAVAATYCPVVERLAETLGDLDVLAALARTAVAAPCEFVRPRLDLTGKTFDIKGASHVLVIANSDKSFIANNLSMDKDTSRLHLITGPNMGGKSTYIRSVALIALLNQIGSFVPCQSAVMPIFDSIMCRVGASDMQLRGISTFMAEMLEASCILNNSTERSLVVIDELGRGTSTSDGFGIAWAIARHLAEEKKCFSLFATHFHELAALEDAAEAVSNRHATAAVDKASGRLTFLYALADGPADQSYGAHVAELAGFPAHVLEASKRRAEEFEATSGGAAKRPRTDGGVDPLIDLLGAKEEDDFVRRALEQFGAQAVAAGVATA